MEQMAQQGALIKDKNIYLLRFKKFEENVTKALLLGNIETRPSDSNGLWCSVLLPAILLNYNALYATTPSYRLAAYVSVGVFLYFSLLMIFLTISSAVINSPFHGGSMACSLTSTLLIYSFLNQDLLVSLFLTFMAVGTSGIMFHSVLKRFPKTFTVGEAIVVSQGVALFTTVSVGKLMMKQEAPAREADLVNSVVYTGLASAVTVIVCFSVLRPHNQTNKNFLHLLMCTGAVAGAILSYVLGITFPIQIGAFLSTKNRLAILFLWMWLTAAAVSVVWRRVSGGARADTRTRKSFHALAAAVFATGALLDRELLKLAAGAALALLLMVESLRKFKLEPYATPLQAAFDLYADEKDMGGFAMTPIYLFGGLACPLLLVPSHPGCELELLSGVLSIGIGDSAASCFGSWCGTHRWPGSERTMEGTAGNIISQIIAVYLLKLFGLLTTDYALLRGCVAAAVSGLVEGGTSQVDNLILPLVTILAFQATWFL